MPQEPVAFSLTYADRIDRLERTVARLIGLLGETVDPDALARVRAMLHAEPVSAEPQSMPPTTPLQQSPAISKPAA